MRVKQIWNVIPFPAQMKLVWDRLTLSRLTTAYFAFSICHCIIQVALQLRAFTINAEAASLLWHLAIDSKITNSSLLVPDLHEDYLQLCPNVPTDINVDTACKVVWNATAPFEAFPQNNEAAAHTNNGNLLSSLTSQSSSRLPITSSSYVASADSTTVVALVSTPSSSPTQTTTIFVTAGALPTGSLDSLDSIGDDEEDDEDKLLDFDKRQFEVLAFNNDRSTTVAINGQDEVLSAECLWTLYWPVSILDNTKREDIVFIAFHFWVLGMSIVALLNESIPHIFASLATHMMGTAWSSYQIIHTANFKSTFSTVITEGSCNGVSLLPRYWDERARAEYPTLGLNIVALLISAFLTWKLIKLFGWQTFKRVGASLTINRIYKLVLALSIVLQLSFFFTGATVSLWLDNLFNGVAAEVVWYMALYKASSFATAILLIPWLGTGWFAIRKEKRILMFVFLILSILYLAGWSVMFLSTTFRWTFVNWRFFSVIATFSVLLTITAFALGIVCRYNFGKGLVRYLNAQEPLPGDDFAPVTSGTDIEKVAFPSSGSPIPTFSATFGSGDEVPPPRQMFANKLGPRFFNRSAAPFETASDMSHATVAIPQAAVSRSASDGSDTLVHGHHQVTIGRSNTKTSIGSFHSYYNYSSSDSGHGHNKLQSVDSTQTMSGKRWVIE